MVKQRSKVDRTPTKPCLNHEFRDAVELGPRIHWASDSLLYIATALWFCSGHFWKAKWTYPTRMSNVGCSCYFHHLSISICLGAVFYHKVRSSTTGQKTSQNFRSLSKIGQLFLILAGQKTEDATGKKFLQLFGRLLLVLMFIQHIGHDDLKVKRLNFTTGSKAKYSVNLCS